MYITTTGLVLRETEYKETSRILTVLTASEGKITVSARGAKRKGSKIAASSQLLAFSEMTMSGRNGKWTLTEARSIELFQGLRDDIEKLAIGSYFAELLEAVSDEDYPNPEILSLGLNGLYALSEDIRPRELVKAAFELRLLCLAGFAPALDFCSVCGESFVESGALDLTGGILKCRKCGGYGESDIPLESGTLAAMRHIVSADGKRVFSFSLSDKGMRELSEICEKYALLHLERGFKTLDFYKSVKI